MDDKALMDRPLSLRIMYKTLFNSTFSKTPLDKFTTSMNDLAFTLFENKEVINQEVDNVTCIATHKNFPLIFAATKSGDIWVIWSQTMRVISHLHGARHPILKIIISPSGDRVLGIDSNGHVIIWRFNLLQKRIHVETFTKSGNTIDACFVNDSSLFAVLNKESVALEDLLTGSTLSSSHIADITGNWIFFLPATQKLLIVNAKKRQLTLLDPVSKAIMNDYYMDSTTTELAACITNKSGSVVCVGTQEGEVVLLNGRSLSVIITYHPFESAQLGNIQSLQRRR
jgi:WD40 repeat protein